MIKSRSCFDGLLMVVWAHCKMISTRDTRRSVEMGPWIGQGDGPKSGGQSSTRRARRIAHEPRGSEIIQDAKPKTSKRRSNL